VSGAVNATEANKGRKFYSYMTGGWTSW